MPRQMFYTTERISGNIARTPEHFLICTDVPVARVGMMAYSPGEVPDDLEPDGDGTILVEREPADVFAPASIASLQGKPFTNEHPLENGERVDITPDNWQRYVKGTVINPRQGDGISNDLLFVDIIVFDPDTIDAILGGKRELSCGYEAEYVQTSPGHAKQTNIIYNHLSAVDSGRCGPRCAIRDDGTCSLHGRQVRDSRSTNELPPATLPPAPRPRVRHLHLHV